MLALAIFAGLLLNAIKCVDLGLEYNNDRATGRNAG
jgi:hypothetical protein